MRINVLFCAQASPTATGMHQSPLELRNPSRNSKCSSLRRDELSLKVEGSLNQEQHRSTPPIIQTHTVYFETDRQHNLYSQPNLALLKSRSFLHAKNNTNNAVNYSSLQYVPVRSSVPPSRRDDLRERCLPVIASLTDAPDSHYTNSHAADIHYKRGTEKYPTVSDMSSPVGTVNSCSEREPAVLLNGSREMAVDVGPEDDSAVIKRQGSRKEMVSQLPQALTNLKSNAINKNSQTNNTAVYIKQKITQSKSCVNRDELEISKLTSDFNQSTELGKLKNLWKKMLYKNDKTPDNKSDDTSDNNINSSDGENFGFGLTLPAPDNNTTNFGYDNPAFSDLTHGNDGPQVQQDGFKNSSVGDEAKHNCEVMTESSRNTNYKVPSNFNNSNINMISTSAQTNITSFQLRKNEISRSTPDFLHNSPLSPPAKTSLHGSNSYITTSNISSEAVVKVAKALRARSQHQQLQKEYRHRQAMETSSVRYCRRNNASLIDLRNGEDFIDGKPNSHLSEHSVYNVSAIIDSFESSVGDFNSMNSKQDVQSNKIGPIPDGAFSYFSPTKPLNYSANDFGSLQEHVYGEKAFNKLENFVSSVEYPLNNSSVRNDPTPVPLFLKTFQSPKESATLNNITTPRRNNAGNIVYAELSFSNNRAAAVNICSSDKFHSLDLNREKRTNYTTLMYPPPSLNNTLDRCEEIEI